MKRALAKKKEYEAYLRSPEWDAKRALVLERDGHRCVRCGSKRKLQVHHKTYARFKEELLDDLETLCGGQAGCHKVEHRSERWKNQRRAVVGKA